MGAAAAWAAEESPGQVDRERLVPGFEWEVFESPGDGTAHAGLGMLGVEFWVEGGAVYQDIQPAKCLQGRIDQAPDIFRSGDISLDRECRRSSPGDALCQGICGLLVDVGNNNGCAGLRQRPAKLGAKQTGPPGDQGNPTVQLE